MKRKSLKAKRVVKAEELEKDTELQKDLEKDSDKEELDIKEEDIVEETEEASDEKDSDEKDTEDANEEVLVLDSGATVDENEHPEAEEAEDLVTITKEDGTKIYVEKVTDVESDEEKKEVYEAIVEAENAETPAEDEEASEDLSEELNEDLEDEIDEVSYVAAACHTPRASLNNSYYILKLKGGKIKALKANKVLSPKLKNILLKRFASKQELPEPTTIFQKIADKVGYTFGSFYKLASKFTRKAEDTTATIKETSNAKDNDEAKELKNFSLDTNDIEKNKYDSSIALDKKEFDSAVSEETKSAKSRVKSYFGRLPSQSKVGNDPVWGLRDFDKERNKVEKTTASQLKSLQKAIKTVREQKEIMASQAEEINKLKAELQSINDQKAAMIKNVKINKILAALNITNAEEKMAFEKKYASYNAEKLDAIYEFVTADAVTETNLMHEQMMNDQMKKEASELNGKIPTFNLEENLSGNEEVDMATILKERELAKIRKN